MMRTRMMAAAMSMARGRMHRLGLEKVKKENSMKR
jgi:hypothetical protein